MTGDTTAGEFGERPATEGGQAPDARPRYDMDLVGRRYGGARSGPSRRTQWLVPLLGALVLVAGAALLTFLMGRGPSAEVEHVGYTVQGPSSVEIRFVVVADPGTEVVCTLRAVNQDFTEVGADEVEIGPVTERRTSVQETVTTSERAASGHAESCRPS